MPPRLRHRPRLAYLQTGQRNLVLLRELQTAVDALDAAGVPSIVLKGGALADGLSQHALRPMADIDLLIRREHLDEALAVFGGAGFASTVSECAARRRRTKTR